MQSALWMRDHNLFPAEQWPLCSANGSIRFVQFIEDKKQLSRYAICHDTHWRISLTYFFITHSITASASPSLCCFPLLWPWLHASHLSVDDRATFGHWHYYCIECGIVRPSKDPFLPWRKQQLHPQQQASAPVDFFSLNLDDLGILQLLPLFLLASFYNASFSLHCSNNNKITAVVFVAVAFSGTKAQWGCISGRGIFAEAGQQRIQIVFCPFLSKPHLPHPTISHWKWSTPLPQICWSQGRTGWEKHTIHKSLNFTNCDMLWFAQYICELINWKFCLQDFYCVQ